jgi:hypothetical protein
MLVLEYSLPTFLFDRSAGSIALLKECPILYGPRAINMSLLRSEE